MSWTLNALLVLVIQTLRNPREGASTLLNAAPPRQVIWEMLALVVVVSVLLAHLTSMLAPGVMGGAAGPFNLSPITTGLVQGVLLVIMVYAIFWIGRGFGGTGSLEETLLLVTWLQFILVCVQVLQTVSLFVIPALAGLLGILALGLFFWLLVNFVAILHGFKSLVMVFVGIILSAFALIFALSLLLALIGVTLPGVGDV